MATATIPELIQPGTLYTPDDSAVSVASGYCPNGDDALLIDGSIANFRAYQPAIAGVHYLASPSDDYAIVLWLHQNGTGTGTGNSIATTQTLAGVMDINVAAIGGSRTTSSSTTGVAMLFGIGAVAPAGTPINLHLSVGAASSRYVRISNSGGNPPNAFNQYVFNCGASTRGAYFNGVNTSVTAEGAGTPGTPGALTDPYFAIGPYSTVSDWAFPTRAIRIAKFSIFNRVLTPTEMSDLYTSMTLGPPSP